MGIPLVSIITPCYNHGKYLGENIESVAAQTYPNIEHIVIDDGSTDNTTDVMLKYGTQIIGALQTNHGETYTTNRGFNLSIGHYIMVLSADDILLPHAIEKLVDYLESHPDILVAYPDFNYIDDKGNVVGKCVPRDYEYLYMLKRHHCTVGAGALMRRVALDYTGGRDLRCRFAGDFEFWLRLGLCGQFAHIPETMASLRIHPDSCSVRDKSKAMSREHVDIIKRFYLLPGLPVYVIKTKHEALAWAYTVGAVVSGKSYSTKIKYIIAGILYHPWTAWHWLPGFAPKIIIRLIHFMKNGGRV